MCWVLALALLFVWVVVLGVCVVSTVLEFYYRGAGDERHGD